jgi:hypothetical protein
VDDHAVVRIDNLVHPPFEWVIAHW